MRTTENQKRFSEYHRLADQLMDASEKDVLMETARMRALHVSYYQSKVRQGLTGGNYGYFIPCH